MMKQILQSLAILSCLIFDVNFWFPGFLINRESRSFCLELPGGLAILADAGNEFRSGTRPERSLC